MKRLLLVLISIAFIATSAFAQTATGGRRRTSTTYTLTITTNVVGATIAVDGEELKGNALEVTPGNHTILVQAQGYSDWQQTVSVTSNTTVRANLEPSTYQLQIQSNVSNAQVYLNGSRIGSGNQTRDLQPGSYSVRISAPGFIDFNINVQMNRNQVVRATLQPAPARITIQIPDDVQTPGTRDVISLVKVFLNDQLQPYTTFDVEPGRHRIRLTSGGFSVEQTYVFDAGRSYTIVPRLTLSVE